MFIIRIILIAITLITFLVFLTAFICFYFAFYNTEKNKADKETYSIPEGKVYKPYRAQMIEWQKQIDNMPHDNVSVTSFDGLKLHGKYYELKKGAPIELMMHGYRGNSRRDLCGGVTRAFALEHNVLLIDQRASGESEGNIISFGINESRDALTWLEYLQNRFGNDVCIILTGVSMGASTVLMCIERGLPKCVKSILADCGYSSTKNIIKKVIKEMKLPADILYPFVKMGAKIYGRFDLEEIVPLEAVKKSSVPILFAHGDNDDFVPYYMSVQNYEACSSKKLLVTIRGAGHGLCYPTCPDEYVKALSDFFTYLKQ